MLSRREVAALSSTEAGGLHEQFRACALAVLNIVTPPVQVVEPIIALSIVYVGVDNLMVRGGRDMRVWIALVFGLIHGFGFASVLQEMGLPSGALGWSLFSFNLGVEIGQITVAVVVASLVDPSLLILHLLLQHRHPIVVLDLARRDFGVNL